MGNGSEQITDVTVEGDAPCGDLLRDEGLAFVDTDVLCLWVLKDLSPEVVFDDAGRIGTDPPAPDRRSHGGGDAAHNPHNVWRPHASLRPRRRCRPPAG